MYDRALTLGEIQEVYEDRGATAEVNIVAVNVSGLTDFIAELTASGRSPKRMQN